MVHDHVIAKFEIDIEYDWVDSCHIHAVSLAKSNNHSDFLMRLLMGISESVKKMLAMRGLLEDYDKL